MPVFKAADLAAWSGGSWSDPSCEACATGVSTDTRTLRSGDLYVALKGERFDGHAFLQEAVARGAVGAVIEAGRKEEVAGKCPFLLVPDTLVALQDIARHHRRRTAARVLGITGSVGKSTVKEMVSQILSRRLRVASTLGNWNNHVGMPLSLLAMDASDEAGVFEVATNHPGEIAALCGVLEPDWGLVTEVGPAHMEFFASVSDVAEEKAELLRAVPPDGKGFLNRECAHFDTLCEAAQSPMVTVSIREDADYRLLRRDATARTAVIRERATGEKFEFRCPLPGLHHVGNAMLAIAVARAWELDWDAISAGLGEFQPMPMRWQREVIAGVLVINDGYNANPISMRAAVHAFEEEPIQGSRWVVLAGMLELGRASAEEHRALGILMAAGACRGLFAIGKMGEQIADAAVEAGMSPDRVFRCTDNREASSLLVSRVKPGDGVLLKGSRGMRVEEIFGLLEDGLSGG